MRRHAKWAIKLDKKRPGSVNTKCGYIWVTQALKYGRKRDRKLFSLKKDATLEMYAEDGEVLVRVDG